MKRPGKLYRQYLDRAKDLGEFFTDEFDDLKGDSSRYMSQMKKDGYIKLITKGYFEWTNKQWTEDMLLTLRRFDRQLKLLKEVGVIKQRSDGYFKVMVDL